MSARGVSIEPLGREARGANATRVVLAATATLVLVLAGGPRPASAEPTKAGDRAASRTLFYEARALMKEGDYAGACPKLEESLRLGHGIGTEYNLADCNEKIGKLAEAWSGFSSVAAAAKARGQTQREKVARDRAKALEPRLPKLAADDPSPAPPPDRKAKRDDAARPAVPRTVIAPPTTPDDPDEPDEPEHERLSSFSEPMVERGATQRTVGWIVSAVGVVGLGVGAGFGIDSLQKRDRANERCAGDLCDRRGVSLRDKAIQSGDVATVATIAGGAALLGGVVLLLTAPRDRSHTEAPTTALSSLRAAPHVAADGGGVSLGGVF